MLSTVGWLLFAAGCGTPSPAAGDPDVSDDCVEPCDVPPGCEATAETCDGLDNDCDGRVDDDATDAGTWYVDADGDGLGAEAGAVVACDAPADAVADAGDCDDGDAAVHPGAVEACNTLDDDCDGAVDAADPDLPDGCPGDDPGGDATLPSELIDLTNWKLTLPIGEAESPQEILQPELAAYTVDPWFHLSEDRDTVVFRANAGGVTTGGSSYPRSELREMTNGGVDRASWSTASGVHTMTVTQAVLHLPEVKPHVVVGQIHDAEDDLVMIRLEEDYLFVEGGGEDLGALDPAYVLGEEFTVRIVAADGWIDIYYQDLSTPAVSVERDTDGCYFKAGAYTQSNTERGDAADAYGEVAIRRLDVTHE